MKNKFITKSAEETRNLGEELSIALKKGNVVALYGELGAGKTTFVQGLSKGLGIKRRIISPTFIIVRRYKLTTHNSKIKSFYHIDLYRVGSPADIQSLGLDEIFESQDSIIVVEWPEKLGSKLPVKRWNIKFEHQQDKNKRKITYGRGS